MSVWSILLQSGTSAFPGSLYSDFTWHVILDQRETSLGTAIFFNLSYVNISIFQYDMQAFSNPLSSSASSAEPTWTYVLTWNVAMLQKVLRMPPYFVAIECCKRRNKLYKTFTPKYFYLKRISWPLFKEAFLRVLALGWTWMPIRRKFDGHAFYSRTSFHSFCAF